MTVRPARHSLALRRGLLVVVAGAVVAADQITKTWALHHAVPMRHIVGPLWWRLTINPGAAFGIGGRFTPVVEAVAVVLVAGLVLLGRRASRRASTAVVAALGLLVGGAVSNLADRVFRHNGGVIDFIDALRIGGQDRWPIFNLADVAIVVGALLLAASLSKRPVPRPDQPGRGHRAADPDRAGRVEGTPAEPGGGPARDRLAGRG